jgi:histidyl-tRNA synthetase
MANPSAKQGISDMDILFTLLRAYKVLDKVGSFFVNQHMT